MPVLALALVGLALVPRVVVVRDGTRTVLSVQSELPHPWPLPVGVSRQDATPVPASAFDEIDLMDAPTLGEAWEADPCPPPSSREYEGSMQAASEQGSVKRFVEAPPLPPRRHVNTHTTTAGFRIETSAPTLVVPVVAGQEVVVHVLAPSAYDAVDVDVPGVSVTLPETIEVPVAVRGSFPELYQGLFEHAARSHPGVVVREFIGYPNLGKASLATFGFAGTQAVLGTRLHVRPAAGTAQIVLAPSRESAHGGSAFEVQHPWAAPIRCVDPERGVWSMGPSVPVAPERTPPVATADELLRIELPALGLHAVPWWRRLRPFDGGALAGGGLGLCVALLVRRRSPP